MSDKKNNLMKTNRKMRELIFFTIIFLTFSCSSQLKNDVSVSVENEFPTIALSNQNGHDIIIMPESDSSGSIGYRTDNEIIWLTGMPETIETSEKLVSYQWNNNELFPISLIIEEIDENYTISLKSEEGNTPVQEWFLNIEATDDEYFSGIFERVVDGNQRNSWADNIKTALDLRGERVDMKLKPTVSAYAPFYISSENYGFFVKGTWPGVFDFCSENNDLVKIAFEGPTFDFKIYQAECPLGLVQMHALETGPSIVPPKWAFGPWRWRDQHFNNTYYYDKTNKKAPYNTDLVEDVLMMEALDIPVTAQWIDRPWAIGPRGFDDYEFDLNEFPDPEGMIKWLNSKNQELMIWIGPWVMGDMADYAEKNNYSLTSKVWIDSNQVLMDFSHPDAVKWWGEKGPAKLAKMGIKGFKLDRADGEKLVDSLHLMTGNGTSYRENFNDFPHQYVKATYDAVQPILGDDFVLFPRAQYTGSAKYGAMWAGDTDGKPEGLRSAIIGMQRCAIMGYPIWGSDVGGYWGDFSRETTMRWLGFGCFSPIMETGPTNNLGFWSNPDKPYYDIELIATWRLYSKIRMKLVDYLHTQAKIANEKGTPVAMPLFLKYPEQKEAWNEWQSYLLGPDILVAALWKNEHIEHNVYLPKGNVWVDAWNTEKEYEGGTYVTVDAPLYKIPVFIRKDSNLDLGNLKEIYTESLKIASTKPDLAELEKKEGWK